MELHECYGRISCKSLYLHFLDKKMTILKITKGFNIIYYNVFEIWRNRISLQEPGFDKNKML